jgi:SNF2 family DNA or RNA helicase
LELYQQGVTRLHRQGQTKPVVIFHILARQSIDERVYRVLAKKANMQNLTLQGLSK